LSAGVPTIEEDVATTFPASTQGRKRKSEVHPNGTDTSASTPKRKRSTKAIPPPVTPTPAAAGLMSDPYSTGNNDDSAPAPAINRLAVPNGTNAPLISPETHRLVTNKPLSQVSPSKRPNVKTTSGNILDEALAHLSVHISCFLPVPKSPVIPFYSKKVSNQLIPPHSTQLYKH